tara:strand:- start:1655 stop:2044 length:390 start_codon:yes stop_codon:yes gene_type:complete
MDTVAEFLTRIRNAVRANHEKVDVPSSNLRKGIAAVLKENGYIRNYKVVNDGRQGMMRVYLKYTEDGESVIEQIQRVSTPGRRRYVNVTEIPKVRNGYGLAVLSTNKGIVSGRQAHKENVGGEVLCTVW